MSALKKISAIKDWLRIAYTDQAVVRLRVASSPMLALESPAEKEQCLSVIDLLLRKKSVWTGMISFYPWIDGATRSLFYFSARPLNKALPSPNALALYGKYTLYIWLLDQPVSFEQWQSASMGIDKACGGKPAFVSDRTTIPLPGAVNWKRSPPSTTDLEWHHNEKISISEFPTHHQPKKYNQLTDVDWNNAANKKHVIEWFQERGYEVKGYNNQYHANGCPSCGMQSHNVTRVSLDQNKNVFHCFNCGLSGGILELMVAAGEYANKAEAAHALLGGDVSTTPMTEEERRRRDAATEARNRIAEAQNEKLRDLMTQMFSLARTLPASEYNQCLEYLSKDRCISMDVLREVYKRGLIAFLPHDRRRAAEFLFAKLSKEKMVEAGLMMPESKTPDIARRPVLIPYKNHDGRIMSCEFRLITTPKDSSDPKSKRRGKDLKKTGDIPPWIWEGTNKQLVAAVEGLPDALSLIDMGWAGDVLCVPGIRNWYNNWNRYIQGKHAYFIFDNESDEKTRISISDSMYKIKQMVDGIALSVHTMEPKEHNDINDILRSAKH